MTFLPKILFFPRLAIFTGEPEATALISVNRLASRKRKDINLPIFRIPFSF